MKEGPTIYKKLHAIMEEIGTIEKTGHNDFHDYDYATDKDIKKAVQSALIKHKVVFTPIKKVATRHEQIKTDKSGNKKIEYLTDVEITYTFTDIESGDQVQGVGYGTGQDSADKGTYKAITGAIKYIMTDTFLIPTDSDPEKNNKKPKATSTQVTTTIKSSESFEYECSFCGAIAEKKSGFKNGKPWSGLFCSTKERTHVQWLKDGQEPEKAIRVEDIPF